MKVLLLMFSVLFINTISLAAQETATCPADMLIEQNHAYLRLDNQGNTQPFIANEALAATIVQLFPAPSGAVFAAITEEAGQNQIVLFDHAGELESTRLTCPNRCRWVDWSPDETQLVYVDFAEAEAYTWRIYLVNRSSANARLILETQTFGEGAFIKSAWSPDGQSLAYELLQPMQQRSIFLYDSLTNTHTPLMSAQVGQADGLLDWNADGDYLLFSSNRESGGLFQVRPDGQNAEQLSDRFPLSINWSPSGDQIVFFVSNRGEQAIYILDYAEELSRSITRPGVVITDEDAKPVWSPDGKRIIFQMLWENQYHVFSIRPDGENLVRLTEHPSRFVAWLDCVQTTQ